MLLDRALSGSAGRQCQSQQSTGGTQRNKAVEQRLGVTAYKVFVGGFPDAEIEGVEAALAACLRNAASKEVTHDAWYSSSIAWLVAERASEATSEEEPRLPRLRRSSRRPDDGYGFGSR